MTEFPRTLDEAVRRAAQRWPDRTAWVFDLRDGPEPNTSASLTFAEVANSVERMAKQLHARGITAGDRVAVMLHNRPEFALAWLALASLGAAMVPLGVKSRHDDAAWILDKSRAKALIATPTLAELIAPTQVPVIDVAELTTDSPNVGAPPSPTPDSLANVQFTSGTTGHPKGCLLSHHYWLYLATSLVTGFPRLTPDDRLLTAQPMSYMDPQWNIAAGLVSGASVVVLDGFHPATIWDRLREHEATYFYCVASMPVLMLTTPPDPRDRDHHVRVIQCSAIPPARHAELEDRWGVPWFEVFGMTETGGDIHVTDVDHDECVGTGTIGRAKPGREVRIADADGQAVPVGTIGELTLRGDGMMSGYDDEPEATSLALRGGWMHTGDLARQDERGYLWLVGRLKDVIRRSGENIAAREVEDTLLAHPAVRLAAVVGVPDDIRGEEAKAYVVLTDDRDAASVADDLRAHCLERIARFKVPRYWEVRTDLPRTPSERVAKQQIVPGRTWDAETSSWQPSESHSLRTVTYDGPAHEAAVRRIYEMSFPASVRAEWSTISRHRADEELLVLVDGDDAVAFALIRHLGDTKFTFVRYFAVDATRRGDGYGARLLADLVERLTVHGRTALLLDVEDPAGEPDHPEHVRRIAFYERNGVALLPVVDYAPPEHGSTGEVVPLLLMGRPLGDAPALEGPRLDGAVRAVLVHRYEVEL
ncbi:MAG: GNAT family N-acetyltransferase [Actinomycetales bacterium]|nr:GNAT family N-acetyltransferase [Actinomycetales bacterium]